MPIDQGGNVPPGWTEKFIDAQANPGMGASARYGMRPPSPDSVAERGTPQWRAAFNAQRQWMQHNMFAGATLNDLGFSPEKEHGLHAYTALREGDFSPFDSSWAQAARGSARGTYNSTTGAYTQTRAQSPTYGQPKAPQSLGVMDPIASPLGGEAPLDPAQGSTGGGSFYTPTPTDTYMTNPRRKTLRNFG